MNILRTAAIAITADDAMHVLCRALGIEEQYRADNLPDRKEWRRAPDDQRLMWLGEWLKSTAYQMADQVATAPAREMFIAGGEKYAHQND